MDVDPERIRRVLRRPRGADLVEVRLRSWAESFEASVADLQPAVTEDRCWECREVTTVYGFAAARTGDPLAPWQCRVCVITGAMRVLKTRLDWAVYKAQRDRPPS